MRKYYKTAPPSLFRDIAFSILSLVAREYGFTSEQLLAAGNSRQNSKVISEARQVFMSLVPGNSAQIGAFMGFTGHAAVIQAKGRVQDWEDVYSPFREKMERLRSERDRVLNSKRDNRTPIFIFHQALAKEAL